MFTTQHQAVFDHPKIHSIPIGVGNSPDGANALLRQLSKQAKQWKQQTDAEAPIKSTAKAKVARSLVPSKTNNTQTNNNRRGRRRRRRSLQKTIAWGEHKDKHNKSPPSGGTASATKSNNHGNTFALRDNDPRTQLLMINSSPTPTRTPQIEAVIRNFENSGLPEAKGLANTYGREDTIDGDRNTDARTRYHNEISRSKFILCPSGIGWDTYRIWESIVLGAIPVIERHVYRYQKVVYPPSSNRRDRLLHPGEHGVRTHLLRHNASLETVEYLDGWRKSLDDLPVVWIDGTFGDHLTPKLLMERYDALAKREGEFRYEKLTSLYWIQFVESFLLKNSGNNGNKYNDDEALVWQRAMETLPATFNDHSTSVKTFMKKAAAEQNDDDLVVRDAGGSNDDNIDDVDNIDADDDAGVPAYLFGSHQPQILSWVLFLELKLAGIVLVVIAVRRWDSNPDKTRYNTGDVGSNR